MNYEVSKETIAFSNLVFDGCQEAPIDLDFSLPDYCPDIQRILKCQIIPNISSRNISGDRLNIEGVVALRLIYLDSDKMSVRCCENSSPFSCSFDLRSAPDNPVAVTCTRLEYVNCRAVSSRKIDVHGAFSICAKVYNKDSMEVTCRIDGEDVQQKISDVSSSNLVGIGQQQFSVNEVLDLGQGKPNPEVIIRSDVILSASDYKAMANKVVVKGDMIIKILYISDIDSGQMQTVEYSIPVSQIVDVPGVSEGCSCIIKTEILNHEEQIHTDGESQGNLISTDIKASATVMSYSDKQMSLVSDVYSTSYDIECSKENIKLCKLTDTLNDSFSNKPSIDLPGFKISKVIDVWSDISSSIGSYNNNKITFTGKMNICMLALDSEEIPFYIERIIDLEYQKDFNGGTENYEIECNMFPTSIGYRITGSDSLEIKADIKLYANIYLCNRYTVITGASADENLPKIKDTNAALTIYYADEGESVWNIARKYYTSVSDVKQENDLDSEIVEQKRMLLIPMK